MSKYSPWALSQKLILEAGVLNSEEEIEGLLYKEGVSQGEVWEYLAFRGMLDSEVVRVIEGNDEQAYCLYFFPYNPRQLMLLVHPDYSCWGLPISISLVKDLEGVPDGLAPAQRQLLANAVSKTLRSLSFREGYIIYNLYKAGLIQGRFCTNGYLAAYWEEGSRMARFIDCSTWDSQVLDVPTVKALAHVLPKYVGELLSKMDFVCYKLNGSITPTC